jgi:hypothetical protein
VDSEAATREQWRRHDTRSKLKHSPRQISVKSPEARVAEPTNAKPPMPQLRTAFLPRTDGASSHSGCAETIKDGDAETRAQAISRTVACGFGTVQMNGCFEMCMALEIGHAAARSTACVTDRVQVTGASSLLSAHAAARANETSPERLPPSSNSWSPTSSMARSLRVQPAQLSRFCRELWTLWEIG